MVVTVSKTRVAHLAGEAEGLSGLYGPLPKRPRRFEQMHASDGRHWGHIAAVYPAPTTCRHCVHTGPRAHICPQINEAVTQGTKDQRVYVTCPGYTVSKCPEHEKPSEISRRGFWQNGDRKLRRCRT